MPKHTEDPAARDAARELFVNVDAEKFADTGSAAFIVDSFPIAEFESSHSRVGGEQVTLRRVVLIGPWQVVTK